MNLLLVNLLMEAARPAALLLLEVEGVDPGPAAQPDGHRVAMSVCVSVIKIVIVDNGQSIRFFVFLHQTEWAGMVLRILNLEEHQNCMIGSKVTTVLTTFFLPDD